MLIFLWQIFAQSTTHRHFQWYGKTSQNQTQIKDIAYLSNIAAIHGANGSGKTNLIKALKFCQYFILNSHKNKSQGDETGVMPFLFDSKTPNEPSEFAISFIHENYFFEYGFELDIEYLDNTFGGLPHIGNGDNV